MITPAEVTDEDLEACLFTPDDYLARERVAACWNRLLSKHRVISEEDVEKLQHLKDMLDKNIRKEYYELVLKNIKTELSSILETLDK